MNATVVCAFGDASGDIRGVSMARCRSGQRLSQDRANTAAPLSRNCSHVDVSMLLLTGQLVPPTRCTSSLAAGESLGEALYVLMSLMLTPHTNSVVHGYMACTRYRSSLASAAGGTRQLHRAERSAHWHIPLIPPTWADWAATTPAGGAQHPYAPRCTAYGTAAGGCTPGASMKGVGLTGVTLCSIVGRPCDSPLAFAAVSNCVNAVP